MRSRSLTEQPLTTPTRSRDRFEAFVRKKTHEASQAALPSYVTEFDRAGSDLERFGNEWTRSVFDGDFYATPAPAASRPACSLVFVQSGNGNTVTSDPSTLGGGKTDKHLIYEGLSQVAADAVVSGANTLGGDMVFSVWHPELVRLRAALGKPRHPIQIVATLRGLDLDDHLIFNVPEVRVLVVTIAEGATRMRDALESRPWISPLVMDRADDLPASFEACRRVGIARISAVGGRTLATQLLDAGLVQDVYLTTAPLPGGEEDTPFYPRPLSSRAVVRKHGTGVESGVIFEHLQINES
jgi:riboflavin biosynthesis pyrimidine reductase